MKNRRLNCFLLSFVISIENIMSTLLTSNIKCLCNLLILIYDKLYLLLTYEYIKLLVLALLIVITVFLKVQVTVNHLDLDLN